MKRGTVVSVVAVLVIGIMLGGGLISRGENLPIIKDLVAASEWVAPHSSSYQTTTGSKPINIGPTNIADMVEKVNAAVVNIETKVTVATNNPFFNDPFYREFFGNSMRQRTQVETGVGTGSIISDTGYI